MRIAIDALKLDALYVVYSGNRRFTINEGIEAVPLWSVFP
jgi:uncharacterized protein